MIMLIAKNTLLEGKQQEFIELAEKLVLATRKETGCIAYDLVSDQADACVYYFVEKYQDRKALEEHRASAHFQSIIPQLGPLRTMPSEVSVCEVLPFTEE